MTARTAHRVSAAHAALPYVWGFAAAAAMDGVIDMRVLWLPLMAALAVLGAGLAMDAGRAR